MNSIEFKILATIADPETFWEFRFPGEPGTGGCWTFGLTGAGRCTGPELSDIIHNENIPRSTRNALRDLLQVAGLWPQIGAGY